MGACSQRLGRDPACLALDKLRSLHQPEAGLPAIHHPSTHGSKAEVPFWALPFPGWGRSVRAARRGEEGQGRCQAAAWGP